MKMYYFVNKSLSNDIDIDNILKIQLLTNNKMKIITKDGGKIFNGVCDSDMTEYHDEFVEECKKSNVIIENL